MDADEAIPRGIHVLDVVLRHDDSRCSLSHLIARVLLGLMGLREHHRRLRFELVRVVHKDHEDRHFAAIFRWRSIWQATPLGVQDRDH